MAESPKVRLNRAEAESGLASVYGYSGGNTANGERANPNGMTAAHRTLPFGTRVSVKHKHNGRTVSVRINDRGPFIRGRVIDLRCEAKIRPRFARPARGPTAAIGLQQ